MEESHILPAVVPLAGDLKADCVSLLFLYSSFSETCPKIIVWL